MEKNSGHISKALLSFSRWENPEGAFFGSSPENLVDLLRVKYLKVCPALPQDSTLRCSRSQISLDSQPLAIH